MNHTILLVDDDQLILKTLEQRLEHWHTEVYPASTPEQAIEVLKKITPELILLDLMLTKTDGGGDILDYIKGRPDLANIPVLVLTNLDSPDLKADMLRRGVKEYLIKGNLSLDQLQEKVESYLSEDIISKNHES